MIKTPVFDKAITDAEAELSSIQKIDTRSRLKGILHFDEFFIRDSGEGSIWIGVTKTGEGGDFDKELFSKEVIEPFYNKYF